MLLVLLISRVEATPIVVIVHFLIIVVRLASVVTIRGAATRQIEASLHEVQVDCRVFSGHLVRISLPCGQLVLARCNFLQLMLQIDRGGGHVVYQITEAVHEHVWVVALGLARAALIHDYLLLVVGPTVRQFFTPAHDHIIARRR